MQGSRTWASTILLYAFPHASGCDDELYYANECTQGGLLMTLGGTLEFFLGNTFSFVVFCSYGRFIPSRPKLKKANDAPRWFLVYPRSHTDARVQRV